MVGTVKYTQEFTDQYGVKRWIGIELPYDITTRTPAEIFLEAEAAVKAHANTIGDVLQVPKPLPVTPVVQAEKNDAPIDIYQQIAACTTIEELSTFRIYVESQHNPDLIAVYGLRRKQLIGSETEGIIQKADELLPQESELPSPRKKRSLK